MNIEGLLGLILLIAMVFAIIKLFQSSASTEQKLLWTVLIVLLPLIGVIVWYFAGPGDKRLRL